MPNRARTVEVPEADRRELQRRARAKGERARIVLLAADGVPGKQLAARVGCAEQTVVTGAAPLRRKDMRTSPRTTIGTTRGTSRHRPGPPGCGRPATRCGLRERAETQR
jgi:hypothetical protein